MGVGGEEGRQGKEGEGVRDATGDTRGKSRKEDNERRKMKGYQMKEREGYEMKSEVSHGRRKMAM